MVRAVPQLLASHKSISIQHAPYLSVPAFISLRFTSLQLPHLPTPAFGSPALDFQPGTKSRQSHCSSRPTGSQGATGKISKEIEKKKCVIFMNLQRNSEMSMLSNIIIINVIKLQTFTRVFGNCLEFYTSNSKTRKHSASTSLPQSGLWGAQGNLQTLLTHKHYSALRTCHNITYHRPRGSTRIPGAPQGTNQNKKTENQDKTLTNKRETERLTARERERETTTDGARRGIQPAPAAKKDQREQKQAAPSQGGEAHAQATTQLWFRAPASNEGTSVQTKRLSNLNTARPDGRGRPGTRPPKRKNKKRRRQGLHHQNLPAN